MNDQIESPNIKYDTKAIVLNKNVKTHALGCDAWLKS